MRRMKRPEELYYAQTEKPPLLLSLLVAAQHISIIAPTLILIAIVESAANASTIQIRESIARGLIAIAAMTVLQAVNFKGLGSGFLLPPVVTATYLPANLEAVALGGMPLVAGMTIVGGIVEAIFSRFISHLRKVLPAAVSGVILMAVAIELCHVGMSIVFDYDLILRHEFWRVGLASVVTLVPIITLAVWARGLPKILCSLVGIISGYTCSVFLGIFSAHDLSVIMSEPFFATPSFDRLSFQWSGSLVVPFSIAAIANGLRAVGVLTTCQQLNNSDWKRPDIKNIQQGVFTDGIGCFLCGCFGATSAAASPSLVGLEKATGVTSRSIAWLIAFLATVFACLPMFLMFLVQMPKPVMGSVLFFNGSMMFVAGIQIAQSRPLDLRATILIGFSVMLGMGVLMFPEFFTKLPTVTQWFTSSSISVTLISAVGLNMLFLLGRWKKSLAHEDVASSMLSDLLAKDATPWKISQVDLDRITTTTKEVFERAVFNQNANSDISLTSSFDGYDVVVELSYEGNLPSLITQARLPKHDLIEEQSFASGLSGYLAHTDADRIDLKSYGDQCKLRMYFSV